jgi:hypothetical protein
VERGGWQVARLLIAARGAGKSLDEIVGTNRGHPAKRGAAHGVFEGLHPFATPFWYPFRVTNGVDRSPDAFEDWADNEDPEYCGPRSRLFRYGSGRLSTGGRSRGEGCGGGACAGPP